MKLLQENIITATDLVLLAREPRGSLVCTRIAFTHAFRFWISYILTPGFWQFILSWNFCTSELTRQSSSGTRRVERQRRERACMTQFISKRSWRYWLSNNCGVDEILRLLLVWKSLLCEETRWCFVPRRSSAQWLALLSSFPLPSLLSSHRGRLLPDPALIFRVLRIKMSHAQELTNQKLEIHLETVA